MSLQQDILRAVACALPGAAVVLLATLVPQWNDLLPGALVGCVLAACAALAGVLAGRQEILGALGWRLTAVLMRIAGTALAMAVLARLEQPRSAVVALIAAVAAGWLVEMAAMTLRLAQERKPARG